MAELPLVHTGLLLHNLDEQVLVYDPIVDRVHLLDATTGTVLRALQRPLATRENIVSEIGGYPGEGVHEALLDLSIDEIRKANLLVESDDSRSPLPDVSRRSLIKKLTVAGISALVIPGIVTLSPTTAGAQGSCLPIGSACTTNTQCCNGSNGAPHCHHVGSDPPGNFCHNT